MELIKSDGFLSVYSRITLRIAYIMRTMMLLWHNYDEHRRCCANASEREREQTDVSKAKHLSDKMM